MPFRAYGSCRFEKFQSDSSHLPGNIKANITVNN